jgi:hypothetical protein
MKKYELTAKYKTFYILISLIAFVPLAIFAYLFRNILCFNLVLYLFILLGIVRLAYWIQNESIVISENGIIYKTSGITIETSWNAIEEIKKTFIFVFFTRQECLIVDQSKIRIVSTSVLGIYLSPIPAGLNLQKAIIPLSHFSDNWRDSDLGQQIKQLAPHLFEKEKSV